MPRSLVWVVWIIVAGGLHCLPARAEYRVFRLVISNIDTGQSRTVMSTLDDIQYPMYHHMASNESIAIEASWMCWRRSDHLRPLCAQPSLSAPIAPSTID